MSNSFTHFFIIGAPKCGTTSLAEWLKAHPQVFVTNPKEPHYYNTDLQYHHVSSEKQYRSLFRGVSKQHLAVGEASTLYLYSRDAVPNIERDVQHAKYIVMTRDPVAMAHSLYYHNCRSLEENQSTFEAAWRLQSERALGNQLPYEGMEPAYLQYHAMCSLGSLLERLYEQVAEERILHIPLEALQADTMAVWQEVLRFLDVPDDGRQEFPAANESATHRNRTLHRLIKYGARMRRKLGITQGLGLSRFNTKSRTKADIPAPFKKELDTCFAEERRKLQVFSKRWEKS